MIQTLMKLLKNKLDLTKILLILVGITTVFIGVTYTNSLKNEITKINTEIKDEKINNFKKSLDEHIKVAEINDKLDDNLSKALKAIDDFELMQKEMLDSNLSEIDILWRSYENSF